MQDIIIKGSRKKITNFQEEKTPIYATIEGLLYSSGMILCNKLLIFTKMGSIAIINYSVKVLVFYLKSHEFR